MFTIVFAGLATSQAIHTSPLTKPDIIIKETNPIQIPYELMRQNFSKSEAASATIYVSLGMLGINKSGNNMWRSDILGQAVPDPEFNPYSNQSQIFMKNLCLDMHVHEFIIPGSVNCWWVDFELFMVKRGIPIPMSYDQMQQGINDWIE